MRLHSSAITLSEVPGELALTLNISGCIFNCKGCHTPELQENTGIKLSLDVLINLIEQNKGISCVCFMGGEQFESTLTWYLRIIQALGLKTCLYTGADKVNPKLLPFLDYLKTGKYIEALGGLGNDSTNQKFINVKTGELLNRKFKKLLA